MDSTPLISPPNQHQPTFLINSAPKQIKWTCRRLWCYVNFFSVVKTTAVETAVVKNAVTFKGTIAHAQNFKEIHLCTLTISIDRKRGNMHFSRNVICEYCTAHNNNNNENPVTPCTFSNLFLFLADTQSCIMPLRNIHWARLNNLPCQLIIHPQQPGKLFSINHLFSKEVCKSLLKLKSLGQRANVMTDKSFLLFN